MLGGEKGELEGGKRGRKGPNKIPFVIAVATTDEGRPQRLLLEVAERCSVELDLGRPAEVANEVRDAFGDAYQRYAAQTPAWFPRLSTPAQTQH